MSDSSFASSSRFLRLVTYNKGLLFGVFPADLEPALAFSGASPVPGSDFLGGGLFTSGFLMVLACSRVVII